MALKHMAKTTNVFTGYHFVSVEGEDNTLVMAICKPMEGKIFEGR
jgi:hypothetical protein